jgi:hypothetical protein
LKWQIQDAVDHPCIILLKVNETKKTLNGEPGTCERIQKNRAIIL